MRPFSKFKASGELRIRSRRPGGEAAIKPKSGRAHATNSIFSLRGVDGHSSTARRFRDLIRDALAGLADPDQAAISLARSAALVSIRIESLQSKIITDEEVDDIKFVRLTDGLGRALRKLDALKQQQAQAQAQAQARPSGVPGSGLAAFLAQVTEAPEVK
jgi:hypothetical protein